MSSTAVGRRCAFVASGGALKGYAFHLGVLEAAERAGFRRLRVGSASDDHTISMFIGSSAGACIAAAAVLLDNLTLVAAAVGLEKADIAPFDQRVLKRFNWGLLKGRGTSGLYSAAGVEDYYRRALASMGIPDDFKGLGAELYVCATQLNSSRKVIFGPKDSAINGEYSKFIAYYNDVRISQAIAASVSVPGIYCPYAIVNRRSGQEFEYIDGEVRETLSLHVARDNGADLVIISNVWMPYHFDPKRGSVSKMGLQMLITHAITQIIEQKVDRIRNEGERFVALLEALRALGSKYQWSPDVVDEVVRTCGEVMRHRIMDEIYVAPDANDSEFTLMNSWTFDLKALKFARKVGYERASKAFEVWARRR